MDNRKYLFKSIKEVKEGLSALLRCSAVPSRCDQGSFLFFSFLFENQAHPRKKKSKVTHSPLSALEAGDKIKYSPQEKMPFRPVKKHRRWHSGPFRWKELKEHI